LRFWPASRAPGRPNFLPLANSQWGGTSINRVGWLALARSRPIAPALEDNRPEQAGRVRPQRPKRSVARRGGESDRGQRG
jgi:hypothetical protein